MQYKELTVGNLSLKFMKFTYDFADGCCLTPKSFPLTGVDMALLAAAAKHGLKVFRCSSKRRLARVYRITDGTSFVDFVPSEGGMKVQRVSVLEHEDFLINKFAKFAFEFGAAWIAGVAPYKHELAMYSRLGFATDPKSKTFALLPLPKLPE